MPPKKNKKIYNGFYMYMQAMMPELKRQGCQFPNGMKDAVPICHPMWKELPDAEKEVYERQAKQMKGLKNGQDASRIDSVGHRLSERIDPVAINEKRRRDERKNVSGKWPDGEGVCLETFYMIDIQSLCNKELPMEQCNGMRYLPCEIACVEFSLNAGIHKSWHKFIEPPPIPTGFRYICKSDSENTHQIPIDKFELSERSYRTICQELLDFIRGNQLGNQNYPPVYCSMGDCNKIEWCLDWLAYQAGTSNKITKVYELEGLVMDLFAHGSSGFPSKNQAHDLLTTSVFDYERNTRCPYHEEIEVKFCSLGICKRYCFCLSDALANIYNLELTGAHLPERPSDPVYTLIEPHELKMDVRPLQNKPSRQRVSDSQNTVTNIRFQEPDMTRRESDFRPFSEKSSVPPALGAGRGVMPVDKPLRRPHTPGIAASFCEKWQGNSKRDQVPDGDDDWPALGASAAPRRDQRKVSTLEKKYAGNSTAPPASVAPLPPAEWQQSQSHNHGSIQDIATPYQKDNIRDISNLLLHQRGRGYLAASQLQPQMENLSLKQQAS